MLEATLTSPANNSQLLVPSNIKKDKLATELLDLATSELCLMHAVIILAANEQVKMCGNATNVFSRAYHKVEAIRMINERLGVPEMATLDSTVGAVAMMALAEVSRPPQNLLCGILIPQLITTGSPEAAMHHMNGLENLVRLRGGLNKTPLKEPILQVITVLVFCFC